MTDTAKAVNVCISYLAFRPGVRHRLYAAVDDGMKAQNLEQDRTTAITVREGPDAEDEGPRITDITGETAIRTDRARRMLADLDQAERALILEANILAGHPVVSMAELAGFLPKLASCVPGRVRTSASVFDRVLGETYGRHAPDPGKAADGEPGCGSCAKLVIKGVPWWSDPLYNGGRPTDLGGALAERVRLCRPCYRFAVEQDPTRLPTVKELGHRFDDPRGRWPVRHAPAA